VVSQPGGGEPFRDSTTISTTNNKSTMEKTKEANEINLNSLIGEKLKAISPSPKSFLTV
jgi:hypothetical protein